MDRNTEVASNLCTECQPSAPLGLVSQCKRHGNSYVKLKESTNLQKFFSGNHLRPWQAGKNLCGWETRKNCLSADVFRPGWLLNFFLEKIESACMPTSQPGSRHVITTWSTAGYSYEKSRCCCPNQQEVHERIKKKIKTEEIGGSVSAPPLNISSINWSKTFHWRHRDIPQHESTVVQEYECTLTGQILRWEDYNFRLRVCNKSVGQNLGLVCYLSLTPGMYISNHFLQ